MPIHSTLPHEKFTHNSNILFYHFSMQNLEHYSICEFEKIMGCKYKNLCLINLATITIYYYLQYPLKYEKFP